MAKVNARAYASPSCVLLCFNWDDGAFHADFLGFSIERDPGYTRTGKAQYLTNKLSFDPVKPNAAPISTDKAPIQKFNWWDGGIEQSDRGRRFVYTITPVRGTGPGNLKALSEEAAEVTVTVPEAEVDGIGTYFNRAVVSSQSFDRLRNGGATLEEQMDWLANGIEQPIGTILKDVQSFRCAIYHLTDKRWVLPAFEETRATGQIVYFESDRDKTSATGIDALSAGAKERIEVLARTKTRLMHNKFVVSDDTVVLMGSANFTPEGFTQQANVIHTVRSPELARAYDERASRLSKDTAARTLAKDAGWTEINDVPGSRLRVFFPPEPAKERQFLDTVIAKIERCSSSVLFCMFTATDAKLLKAILDRGDHGKLVYGLVNNISEPHDDQPEAQSPAAQVAVHIYHRFQSKKDVVGFNYFHGQTAPAGFLPEFSTLDAATANAHGALRSKNPLILKRTREEWVKDAYVEGSKAFQARTALF